MRSVRLAGQRVIVRPPVPDDAAELLRIHRTPEVLRWWGAPDERFPFEQDDRTTFLAIVLDGAPVGWIQFEEEREPDFRFAAVDVFVDPARHRRGVATDAIRAVMRHLVEDRGHHRITIDPCVDNAAAIACYEAVGFERVGVTRASWRDPGGRWRDGLLMDWVAPGVRSPIVTTSSCGAPAS